MGCCGASRTKGPAVARTPLPRGPLAAVVLINMTAGFQMNIIFPFVPFMVEELRQTTVDTGFYVGLLATSYFAGQFVASFIWPPLSDKLGRKKLLLLCRRCCCLGTQQPHALLSRSPKATAEGPASVGLGYTT